MATQKREQLGTDEIQTKLVAFFKANDTTKKSVETISFNVTFENEVKKITLQQEDSNEISGTIQYVIKNGTVFILTPLTR